mmetsp:Transcript_84954/g.237065  ORF Transcript_84954/g.237065 Transcript_84954/m.237065 type:complete len:206 (-) Transcript_84954:252-869(-)
MAQAILAQVVNWVRRSSPGPLPRLHASSDASLRREFRPSAMALRGSCLLALGCAVALTPTAFLGWAPSSTPRAMARETPELRGATMFVAAGVEEPVPASGVWHGFAAAAAAAAAALVVGVLGGPQATQARPWAAGADGIAVRQHVKKPLMTDAQRQDIRAASLPQLYKEYARDVEVKKMSIVTPEVKAARAEKMREHAKNVEIPA